MIDSDLYDVLGAFGFCVAPRGLPVLGSNIPIGGLSLFKGGGGVGAPGAIAGGTLWPGQGLFDPPCGLPVLGSNIPTVDAPLPATAGVRSTGGRVAFQPMAAISRSTPATINAAWGPESWRFMERVLVPKNDLTSNL